MASRDPGIEQLRQELGGVESRLAERLDKFGARTDERFTAIDQRFTAIDQQFPAIDQRFTAIDQQFPAIDQRFTAIDQRLVAMFEHIDATAAETRRHFDVVAESLRSTIRLVADGVATLDDKVERFRDETRENFERVDRRFLHLEARVSSLERR